MGGARKSKVEKSRQFVQLSREIHSLSQHEVDAAIERLGSLRDPNAARELIRFFSHCGWRSTQFKILSALSLHVTDRSLDFLIHQAARQDDFPIAEAAIRALGKSGSRWAGRFLRSLYLGGAELARPSIVGALSELRDLSLKPLFLAELRAALSDGRVALAKNLIVTLGEWKVVEAIPILEEVVLTAPDQQLCWVALTSLGKLCRDHNIFTQAEGLYSSDLFEAQLFRMAATQARFRAQWKIEDYLNRIFSDSRPHPSLPLELNSFDAVDVKEGLKLFDASEHFDRLCFTLGGLTFEGLADWYFELFEVSTLSAEQKRTWALSLSFHLDSHSRNRIAFLKSEQPLVWLQTVAVSSSGSLSEIAHFYKSESFLGLAPGERIEAINLLVQVGLTCLSEPDGMRVVQGVLEGLLFDDRSLAVQARVLRALGQLRLTSQKVMGWIKEHFTTAEFFDSVLAYIEQLGPILKAKSVAYIYDLIATPVLTRRHYPLFLRACARLADVPRDEKNLDFLLKECLDSRAALELRVLALQFLHRHPRASFLGRVQDAVASSIPQIQLNAVIALEAFEAADSIDSLGPLLATSDEVLRGRVLHTLAAVPGIRAKRILIDALKASSDDLHLVEKICRSLKVPESGAHYFIESVNHVLTQSPDHPLKDALLSLRDRVGQGQVGGGTARLKPEDIQAIDRSLAERILKYPSYDDAVKSALRSAEVPFLHPELYGEFVDKSASVIEYCKAVDLLLDREVGRKLLLPKIERNLQEFQNHIYSLELNGSSLDFDRILRKMGLEKEFQPQSFPLHKLSSVAQAVLSGRVLDQRFNVMDGLRAWASVLLLFGRRVQGPDGFQLRPLLIFKSQDDALIVNISKKLMQLQDARNPAAHRQTYTGLKEVDAIRASVFYLFTLLDQLL